MTRPAPPARRLLTGPAGAGKTQMALERVRSSATVAGARGRGARGAGDVLLLVPTYAQAMHVARLALSRWDARAVLDDPFATFTSMGERYLDAFRVRTLPSSVERDALMEEALRRAGVEVFEAIRDRPGFRARLLRLVKEVKQSGLAGDEARLRLEANATHLSEDAAVRLRGFLRVFARYDELLDAAGLEDHEDTLRRLLEELRRAPPVRGPRVVVVDGFDDFTPVEQAILDALDDAVVGRGGEVWVTLPWDGGRPGLFAASRPAREHLLARGYVESVLDGFPRAPDTTLARIATDLFRPTASSSEPSDATLEVIVAGDGEDEAEAVARAARRLHAQPGLLRGWRDLGVVVRRVDPLGHRLLAAFDRLGIPARWLGGGSALASQGLVRALLGPLRVLGGHIAAGRFEAPALITWLRWRAQALGAGDDLAATDRLEMDARRDGWPADLEAFARAADRAGLDVAALTELAGIVGAQRGWALLGPSLERAVSTLAPLPPSGGLDAAGRPVDPEAAQRRRLAAAARDRVLALLASLTEAAARTGLGADVEGPEAVAAWIEAIEQARVAWPDRRLDVVNVLDAEEARLWELPVVIVAGLAEGEFPLRPTEDVLLRDGERDQLGAGPQGVVLPRARDREARERRLFYAVLTRARKRLVLVRSGATDEGDSRAGSLFLRDLERIVALDAVTTRRPAARSAPRRDECYTVRDWRLFAAATARSPHATAADVDLARGLLEEDAEGLLRRAARWKRELTDPVSMEAWGARMTASVARLSATTLRAARLCRYRHFLRSVVGVPEDDVPFDGPGFDARVEGTLVHEALCRAIRQPERSAEQIASDVAAWSASRGGREVGRLDEGLRRYKLAELARVVELLRRRVASRPGPFAVRADWLELEFGHDAPLVLEHEGRSIALHGRVDRVDVAGPLAAVLDYKLSKDGAQQAYKAAQSGLDLQLPLYARAVEQLLGCEVVSLAWVAARTRGAFVVGTESRPVPCDDTEPGAMELLSSAAYRGLLDGAVSAAVALAEDVRAGGHDRQAEDAKRCGTCAWRTVCRPGHLFLSEDDADDTGGDG